MLQFYRIVPCQEILDRNLPVCWSIVMQEKSNIDSPFSGDFPFDLIPKATENVNIYFFIHSSNSYQLYQLIPGNF
jgi:hypothetical protein